MASLRGAGLLYNTVPDPQLAAPLCCAAVCIVRRRSGLVVVAAGAGCIYASGQRQGICIGPDPQLPLPCCWLSSDEAVQLSCCGQLTRSYSEPYDGSHFRGNSVRFSRCITSNFILTFGIYVIYAIYPCPIFCSFLLLISTMTAATIFCNEFRLKYKLA